jgi:hypothetical protein
VTRRRFLVMMATGLAVLAGLARLLRPTRAPSGPASRTAFQSSLVPPESQALLLAIGDAVVPAWRGHPGAGQIDLLPQLERWVNASPGRRQRYREWPRFETDLRARLSFDGEAPEPQVLSDHLETLYREFRSGRVPSPAARFFERLRRDVLRVYYASPAGWASVGYTGPARHAPSGSAATG